MRGSTILQFLERWFPPAAMADPLSVTSAVITLVIFACQSSKLLYETVSSFQSSQRNVRELKEELEALDGVLQALQKTVANNNTDFTALRLPLLRCGTACRDFEEVILKCTTHSDRARTSFRDWAKLKYMGDDIVGFKNMLAGYKSTIIIALGDANIRTSVVTQNFLEEFKHMITDTTTDLSQHIEEIDMKLKSLQGLGGSGEQTGELARIHEEKESAQYCLRLCTEVYNHLDQALPADLTSLQQSQASKLKSDHEPISLVTTRESLATCKDTITNTTTWLEKHLRTIDGQLKFLSTTGSDAVERKNLEQEIESARQCLRICSQASQQTENARSNVFEDVSMADDGYQVMVSTVGDLISAKRITAGARSLQIMGQMSDDSLQNISRNYGTAEQTKSGVNESRSHFNDRHGNGVRLS